MKVIPMIEINKRQPARKANHVADDVADLAVFIIAARFHLPMNIARVVAEHAGLGRSDDQASGSGGRIK